MVEMRSRLAYRKSESGNPPPTAGAPELYPNPAYGSDIEALSTETERPKLGRTYGAWRQSSTLLLGGAVETSASFEARSAPPPYPAGKVSVLTLIFPLRVKMPFSGRLAYVLL
jgi:hypothetical protein